jgi:LuxR family maltose regulon positive regulatory protein
MTTAELPFDLVDAKLAVPALRVHSVARTELVDRLRESPIRAVSVVAPAGSGKTTLIAQWAERDPRPFASVSLDGRDNDPVLLLRYIAAALDRVEPLAPSVFEALSGPGRSIWSTCVPRVGGALSALRTPTVFVLDDLHFLSNPTCLDAVAVLLEHVPQGSQMVVVTREEPQLPLARLRAHGRLLELGVDDLRMNEGQAGALLRGAGVDLEASEVAELTRRTEGWAAGLYLAALSLQAGAADTTGVEAFTGDDRFVVDYLRFEVLSRMSAEEVRFLTHTSVLDRMCGGLCDALLNRDDSARVLETLERLNRFVIPLDRRRQWYRYHHLFRDLLRNELEQREAAVVPELNRRAMTWCATNEMPAAAIRYGHEAGDEDAVAALVEANAMTTYYEGQIATLEEWFEWCSDEQTLERHPALAVLGTLLYALTGRRQDSARWLRAAERGPQTDAVLADGTPSVEPWIAVARAVTAPAGLPGMLADAELAVTELHPESQWRPTALLSLGVAHALQGNADAAHAALSVAVEVADAVEATDTGFVALGERAVIAMGQGAWEDAASHARRGQALVEQTGLGDYVTSAIVAVASARIAVHEGAIDEARANVARVHRLRPLLTSALPWFSAQVVLELVRIHLALREPEVAGTLLSEVDEILRLRPGLGTLPEHAHELRRRVDASMTPSGGWALSLTAAELRLLPMLATHLSFPQIGERLFLSKNTVKSQATSIYRKFGVSSRAEAIERAVALGLMDDSLHPARAGFIPAG